MRSPAIRAARSGQAAAACRKRSISDMAWKYTSLGQLVCKLGAHPPAERPERVHHPAPRFAEALYVGLALAQVVEHDRLGRDELDRRVGDIGSDGRRDG